MSKRILFFALLFFSFFQFSWNAQAENRVSRKLILKINNIETKTGLICFLVFDSTGDFNDPSSALISNCKKVRKKKSRKIKIGLPDGEYAVVVFHDLNSSTTLDYHADSNLPSEPIGFSGNPTLSDSAPAMADCLVNLTKKRTVLNINLVKL